jgi:glycosyltransferase involved in cell wall biosynthesis
MELSVLIPARNEEWLSRTVADVLAHARAETEVIVVCDGEWANPPLEDHPRLRMIRTPAPIGQRAATNVAARMSNATYVLKLDAHCSMAEGFDQTLIDAARTLGPDVTQIPQMRNLHVFWRICKACGTRFYQGPMTAACDHCQSTEGYRREIVWQPRANTRTDSWRFDHTLHFNYWNGRFNRRSTRSDIEDVMSSVGACFFMRRDQFWRLGGLDESHGSWGQFGVEIACKSWLSGGRHVVNRLTWFAHLFRTQGADFGFPYPMRGSDQDKARAHSRQLWMENTWPGQTRPLSWLIEKFQPIPGWHLPEKEESPTARLDALAKVMAAGATFVPSAATRPSTAA